MLASELIGELVEAIAMGGDREVMLSTAESAQPRITTVRSDGLAVYIRNWIEAHVE